MKPVRIGVIGGGHLGTIHTRLLSGQEGVQLVGVAEPSPEARERLTGQLSVPTVDDYRQLYGRIDAAVVAAPTRHHHDIALDLLSRGVHVLVEKPLAATGEQAERLVAAAEGHGLVLQVGHVERFNPALAAVMPQIGTPRYIEATRCGPYSFRSTDIGVVLDLMIHDLDLVLALVDSTLIDVAAVGSPVFGPREDLAQARLQFANGCVANLTASRVHPEPQRQMQIFWEHGAVRIDFAGPSVQRLSPHPDILNGRIDVDRLSSEQKLQMKQRLFQDYLALEQLPLEPANAILQEQQEFVRAVAYGTPVRVTGRQAAEALQVAERVLNSIARHRWTPTLRKAG
jgi:predicted dehydrogenase